MQKKSKPMQSKTQNNKWEEEVKRIIKLMDEGGLGKKRSIDGRLTYKLDEEDDNDIYVEDTLIRMVEKILSLQLEEVEKEINPKYRCVQCKKCIEEIKEAIKK